MSTLREARSGAFQKELAGRMAGVTTAEHAAAIAGFTVDFCRSHGRGAQPATSDFLDQLIAAGVRNPVDCQPAAEQILAAEEAKELAGRLALARFL